MVSHAEEQETSLKLSLSSIKARAQNACSLVDEDEDTTDFGQSSASETEESSSGFSGNEGGNRVMRRCRFAKTTLETIPATPSMGSKTPSAAEKCRFGTSAFETVPKTPTSGATSQASPPGLSRAAMRKARDAVQPVVAPDGVCRFGATAFDTVPKTPVGAGNWKALKNQFGSPPGLSRAGMRQERDAVGTKAPTWTAQTVDAPAMKMLATTPVFQPCARTAKPNAREALHRIKQDAALLKDLKLQKEMDQSEEDLDTSRDGSSSEEESSADKRCRFGSTALGTVPATPAGGDKCLASPPGLSRAAMRQARDAAGKDKNSAPAWGSLKAR